MNTTNTAKTSPHVRQHILDVAKPLILGKGFTALGLAELLSTAKVPKGSFYHYFASKEAFGEALLETYFAEQLAFLDDLFKGPGNAGERLMRYWQYWLDSQTSGDVHARCLAVKIGAEVCDLSENMRVILERGIEDTIRRLAACIEAGRTDGSLKVTQDAGVLATALHQMWFGASLLVKITHERAPLDAAMSTTRQLLNLAA